MTLGSALWLSSDTCERRCRWEALKLRKYRSSTAFVLFDTESTNAFSPRQNGADKWRWMQWWGGFISMVLPSALCARSSILFQSTWQYHNSTLCGHPLWCVFPCEGCKVWIDGGVFFFFSFLGGSVGGGQCLSGSWSGANRYFPVWAPLEVIPAASAWSKPWLFHLEKKETVIVWADLKGCSKKKKKEIYRIIAVLEKSATCCN